MPASVPEIRGAPFARAAFETDLVANRFLGRVLMILSRPAAVHRILVENAANYVRPYTAQRILGPPIGGGLFLAEGDEWRRQRRMLAPSFAPRAMPDLARHVIRETTGFLDHIAATKGEPTALFAPLQSLTLSIAAAGLFSIDMRDYGDDMRRLARAYTNRLARPTMLDFLLPPGIPTPRDFPRWLFRRRWMRLIAQIIADRRQCKADGTDLFDTLSKTEIERGLFDQQVATMLVTGSETTGAALFWSVYLVASAPDAQERIAAEVSEIDFSDGGIVEVLDRLTYTRAAVQEALRIYPPAFSIVRQALADDVADGVPIPARATIEMSPWVLHRHRLLWNDPDVFDPSRFLPEATPPVRCSYLPFGVGPRACIGQQFALTEAILVLAMLVQRFRIEPTTDRPVRLVARITLQPDDPAPFRLRPRTPG